MAVVTTLVAFSLRQVSIESADVLIERVGSWFRDPALDLHRAVKKANDRTWHTLALALGGEGWLDRVRGFFSAAAVRGMRDHIKAFLREAGVNLAGLTGQFRRNCLAELHALQKQGRLGVDRLDVHLVGHHARDYRRYTDPRGLAEEACHAARRLAGELHAEAPHLAEVVQLPLAGSGVPLLVTAFTFFLRQEIISRPELAGDMLLDGVEQLHAAQANGFKALRETLGWMEDRLDTFYRLVFEQLDGLESTVGRTAVLADDTNRHVHAALRLLEEDRLERSELRQLVHALLEEIHEIKRAGRRRLAVDPDQDERDDRQAVAALLDRSPLTGPVRHLMGEVLDHELAARRQARQVERRAGLRQVGPLDMVFAWVPPGSFHMGSPRDEPGREDDETPHRVRISRGFWLGVYPVTRRQWWGLMRTMPDDRPADDHPIEGLSWHECEEFLDCLAERDPRPYRLPTEAEWEYACRAGTSTPFAFGPRLLPGQANFEGRGGTTPVGRYAANAWGLCDMHGNVMEWCGDWYAPYPGGEALDPRGPAEGAVKVLRGGAWWSPAHACRSAHRSSARPDVSVLPAGFRVVLQEQA
jgi:formylglycine-generating enzyme required for sulfatase activity